MYSLTYYCVETQRSLFQNRLGLWTNPALQDHVVSLLESRTDVPSFDGYSAVARRFCSNIDVVIFRQDKVVSRFLVVLSNDQTSSDAFNKFVASGPNSQSCLEPAAPFCASFSEAAPEFDLLELEWLRTYERGVAWEWAYMRSTPPHQLLAAE